MENVSLQDGILGHLGGQVGPRQLLWPLHSQSPLPKLLDFDHKGFQFWVCWKTALGSRKRLPLLTMVAGIGAGDHHDADGQRLRECMHLWPFLNLERIAGPLWFVDKNHKPQPHS